MGALLIDNPPPASSPHSPTPHPCVPSSSRCLQHTPNPSTLPCSVSRSRLSSECLHCLLPRLPAPGRSPHGHCVGLSAVGQVPPRGVRPRLHSCWPGALWETWAKALSEVMLRHLSAPRANESELIYPPHPFLPQTPLRAPRGQASAHHGHRVVSKQALPLKGLAVLGRRLSASVAGMMA